MITISGDLLVRRIISCAECGTKTWSLHVIRGVRMTPQEIEKEAERCMPNIPIGWSMNGRDYLVCSQCMDSKRK